MGYMKLMDELSHNIQNIMDLAHDAIIEKDYIKASQLIVQARDLIPCTCGFAKR